MGTEGLSAEGAHLGGRSTPSSAEGPGLRTGSAAAAWTRGDVSPSYPAAAAGL